MIRMCTKMKQRSELQKKRSEAMDIYVNPGNLSFTEAVNSQIFWIYRKRGTTKPLFRIGGLMEKAPKESFSRTFK